MLVFVMKQGSNKVELNKLYRINPQTTELFASPLPLKKWKNEAQKKLIVSMEPLIHPFALPCYILLHSGNEAKNKGTELWLKYLTLQHQ